MPFPAHSDAKGGSHLFVTITGGCATFLLLDTNTTGEISTTYHRSFNVGKRVNQDNLDYFLGQNLNIWSKEIGWDLVNCDDGLCMIALEEDDSITGVTLVVDRAFAKESFHSIVLGVDAVIYDEQMSVDTVAAYLDVFDATSIINVIANWDSFKVYVTSGGEVGRKQGNVVVREMSLDTENLDFLSEKTMPSLLGISLRKDELIDAVANIRAQAVTKIGSNAAADVMRAYITAALFNMRDQTLQSFGHDAPEPFLLISGEIARAIPVSHLILGVIDGLQLRGRYTIGIDRRYASLPAASAKEHRTFPIPVNEVYPLRYIYMSTEKGASGKEGKTAFRGKLVEIGNNDDGSNEGEMIIGQAGEIMTFATKNPGRVVLQPARSVYFPNLRREKIDGEQYLSADFSKKDLGVIIDCRKIPVVYGPDAQANMSRVRGWIQGLPEDTSV